MKRTIVTIALCMLVCAPVLAQDQEIMIVFKITGDEASAEHLAMVNAEIFMILEGAGKYQLISAEDLADELMMSPTESLSFCNEEPGCIADIGSGKNARWLVHGDMKKSFDGTKFIVHLALIDAPARKVHAEKFGQFETESNVVQESGNTVRELVGLPVVKPKPKPKITAEVDKPPELKDIHKDSEKPKPKAVVVKKKPEKTGPLSNPWMWTATGVGVVSLTAGIILGVMSNQKIDDAKVQNDQPAGYDLVQDAKSLADYANIAFVVGGAGLTAAVVLLILDVTGDEPPVTPAVACSGTGCTATIHLTFW